MYAIKTNAVTFIDICNVKNRDTHPFSVLLQMLCKMASSDLRERIVCLALQGQSIHQICQNLSIPKFTSACIVKTFRETEGLQPLAKENEKLY